MIKKLLGNYRFHGFNGSLGGIGDLAASLRIITVGGEKRTNKDQLVKEPIWIVCLLVYFFIFVRFL